MFSERAAMHVGYSRLWGGQRKVDGTELEDESRQAKIMLGGSYFVTPKTQLLATLGRDLQLKMASRKSLASIFDCFTYSKSLSNAGYARKISEDITRAVAWQASLRCENHFSAAPLRPPGGGRFFCGAGNVRNPQPMQIISVTLYTHLIPVFGFL